MLKIKEIRNAKNMTLDELALKSGVSKRMISACQQALKLILDEGNTVGKLFHPCTEQRMNTNIKTITAIAGIKKPLTNHSARHTFATLFIRKTSDVATLQRLLGHSRIEETMQYVHITEENLVLQMKRFEETLLF